MSAKHFCCRGCGVKLSTLFCDLGMHPLSNANLKDEGLYAMEAFYPLVGFFCEQCKLAQLIDVEKRENIFNEDYAYFSSYSSSWLNHAKDYVEMISKRLQLNSSSFVVELASNDGYLLKNFALKKIPCLGIEPSKNVADVAVKSGIDTRVEFFGVECAKKIKSEGREADLILGNNVFAHVPDVNDFIGGVSVLLKKDGVVTFEFPHLLRLIEENQFDTIYHEHFSYLSLTSVQIIFERNGLKVIDVEELPTHGGSLRVYGCLSGSSKHQSSNAVAEILNRELRAGLSDGRTYIEFSEKVKRTKRKLLEFLVQEKDNGKTIAAYGAAAKGNTLLNYCGIKTDFIDYVVDLSPQKQGRYTPGTHLPILSPDVLKTTKPDYLLILPWNLSKEIMDQVSYIRDWGGKFVVPIPEVRVLS